VTVGASVRAGAWRCALRALLTSNAPNRTSGGCVRLLRRMQRSGRVE
jgi:hypothetical protein